MATLTLAEPVAVKASSVDAALLATTSYSHGINADKFNASFISNSPLASTPNAPAPSSIIPVSTPNHRDFAAISLLFCIAGSLLALLAVFMAFVWCKKKDYKLCTTRTIWALLPIILIVAGIILFLTKDIRLSTIIVDIWTITNATTVALSVIYMMFGFKQEKNN